MEGKRIKLLTLIFAIIDIHALRTVIKYHDVKEFEDFSENEKEDILKQIQNLPEQPGDALDIFVKSFDELSKTRTRAIMEFDDIYAKMIKGNHDSISKG